jgi:hypothetical protein
MWNLLKRIFMFQMGRSSSRALARTVGLSRLASVLGIIGGLMYMRRNT